MLSSPTDHQFDGAGGPHCQVCMQLEEPHRGQPAPTGNGPEVLPVVLQFLTQRQAKSVPKYGTTLRAHNGRSALRDAREEAADQLMYLTQLEMEWPAVVAQERAVAFRETLEVLELLLSPQPNPDDTLTRVSNAVLRRAISAIQALAGLPPAEPELVRTGPRKGLRRRMRKPHRWHRTKGEDFERCRDCPLERVFRDGPRGGPGLLYRMNGEELASGPAALVRVPACPPAPKGG